MENYIRIVRASENNLKGVSLEIPKNKLVVFTGVSGSGKSSLAFGTIYSEGQRRYIESLSVYARQFLDKMGKPDVEKIEGLTPAIAIDQKSTSKNPRSTVGTVTEVYDYLRLLYARAGVQHCHVCGDKITSMSASDIVNEVLNFPPGSGLVIYAPIVKDKRGNFGDKLDSLRASGFVRVQIDGITVRLDEEQVSLPKTKKHTIKLIMDRVTLNEDNGSRIAQAVERGLIEAFGEIEIEILKSGGDSELVRFSEHLACFRCKVSFEELEPLSFSFNSVKGACHNCNGLGFKFSFDADKILNKSLPLNRGGIKLIFSLDNGFYMNFFSGFCEHLGINPCSRFTDLDDAAQNSLLYGSVEEISFKHDGIVFNQKWRGLAQIALEILKDDADEYACEKRCRECNGDRLNAVSLSVRVAGKRMSDIINMSLEDCHEFFSNEHNFSYLSKEQNQVCEPVLKEIRERLFLLCDVGLGYLTLGRESRNISGGESQRIRIASQIGSGLTGVTYVLDEPSIGLHERDTVKLIKTLRGLQQKGNSVIVVEHDKETILNADFVVDVGPGAGKNGGEIVFSGSVESLLKTNTLSAQYLSGIRDIGCRFDRPQDKFLNLNHVSVNNIKDLSVKIPLNNLVCVTGVSGSGKSSLILQTLIPLAHDFVNNRVRSPQIEGLESIDRVVCLDQSPIGRTPRSNPSTYTGLMDDIRLLFSQTKQARVLGYGPGRFSFNVKGGRCERCKGEGEIKVGMHFLPDVLVRCSSCDGSRYNTRTLDIKYRDHNIAEVLSMSVSEALVVFSRIPRISSRLKTLESVGLGYITLGQSSLSLSGGEAQRVKIARELSRKDTGKTLYILDEPTTGLHFDDIDKLTKVLHELVGLGNSVVVIEHNLDVIKNADFIIDMGPEGGEGGGKVVDVGTVDEIVMNRNVSKSYTAHFLAEEIRRTGALKGIGAKT